MRVTLLNAYAPPDRSATASIVEQALAAFTRAGHDVTLVCGRPSYDVRVDASWRPLTRDRLHGADVLRVGSTANDRASMRGRVANYLSFSALAVPVAASRGADIVVSMTDPPIAPVLGSAVAAARRVPHVAWIQDLHPAFALATGLMRAGAPASAWEAALRRSLASSAAVIVLGRDMEARAIEAGADAKCVHVIHNGGPPPAEIVLAAANESRVARLRGEAKLVALHGGNIGHAGAWDALVAGAKQVAGEGIDLVFVGDGAQKDAVRALASGAPNVRFVDRLPQAEVPAMLAAGDLHVVTTRRGVEGLVVPSKLYGILAAGRPVLVVADDRSEPALLVREHGCGLVADPDDPAAVADALRWAAAHPQDLEAMGRASLAASRCYERGEMLDRLVRIVEDAAQ